MSGTLLQFFHCKLPIASNSVTRKLTSSHQLYKEIPKTLKGRSKSSQEWLMRHLADPYVEKARMLNYRYNLFISIMITADINLFLY